MARIGKTSPFDPKQEEWTQYVERLQHFFSANGYTDADKKKAILLTAIGPATYKMLSSLTSPEKPGDKTYDQLVETMKTHYSPVPSEIVERYRFHTRSRLKDESVADFVAALRAIAIYCNFGNTLDTMLRDRIVCGIGDDHTQRRLLAESTLTLKSAMTIAQSLERASENADTLKKGTAATPIIAGTSEQEAKVHSVKGRNHAGRREPPQQGAQVPCYRCGKSNHLPSMCRFKTAKCHHCGKVGHIRPACQSDKREKNKAQGGVQHVQAEGDATSDASDEEYLLHSVPAVGASQPYYVTLSVAGQKLRMEIDTGASLSLVSEETYTKLWPNKRLLPTSVKLNTYSGEKLPVVGQMQAQVHHDNQSTQLSLMVVKGAGPSLLGRDWLSALRLEWHKVHYHTTLQEVLDQYNAVFEDTLGTLKGYKAKIHMDPSVPPKYCKARPVPYSMRDLVEHELDKLVHEGVIEPVQYADWAAPIVPVLKSD